MRKAEDWADAVDTRLDNANNEIDEAYQFYWSSYYAFEEAEEEIENFDYDPTFEYVDYTEWEAPEDYDLYFDYGVEDCDEDSLQYDCEEECDDDPSLTFCEEEEEEEVSP